LITLVVIVTLILATSKSKYKNIQTLDLVNGTINYTPADIDLVAIQIENETGEYEATSIVPVSGYILSDKSYCNVNGAKDTSIKLSYVNGSVSINDISKKVKCYLYFDKYSAIDKIIGDNTSIEEKTEFTGIATSADTGIYSAPDDYGTSYYFRGLEGSLNNWVKFADSYWRIIRINGNGTIRMIYAGAASGAVSNSNKTGDTTSIGTSMYNHTKNDNAYVGYMMGLSLNGTTQTANTTTGNSTSYSGAHSNTYNSDAKQQIDGWYKTNIVDKGYENYIDINTGFCNDRQLDKTYLTDYAGDGYGVQTSTYAPAGRIDQEQRKTTLTPILQCTNKERDLFTHTSASTGNKKLTYPIGLITGDELIFAGTFGGIRGSSTFYLKTNQGYWTMSPDTYSNSAAASYVFYLMPNGCFFSAPTTSTYGLRPVINLKSDTKFTGTGSTTDPFVVV